VQTPTDAITTTYKLLDFKDGLGKEQYENVGALGDAQNNKKRKLAKNKKPSDKATSENKANPNDAPKEKKVVCCSICRKDHYTKNFPLKQPNLNAMKATKTVAATRLFVGVLQVINAVAEVGSNYVDEEQEFN